MESILDQLPWLIIRGSGIAAVVVMFLLILGGVGHVTGWTYRFMEPLRAWMVHKWLAISMCVMIFLHVGALFFDKYISFGILDILVPFHSKYDNGSQILGISLGWLAIASGVISMYLIFTIIISSLTKLRTKNKKAWRLIHFSSYALIFLLPIHILFSGTDFAQGFLRYATLVLGLILIVALGARIRRKAYGINKTVA